MRPSLLAKTLAAILPRNRACFLHGPPGVGKSAVVRQVADGLGREFRDVRASQLDPVDLRGLPTVQGGKTTWCPPDFLPTSGSGILFLDELPQAEPLVRKALFQLVLDRRVGNYVLPDDWSVMAAGNQVEDRAGAGRIETALSNRFIHYDMEVSVEDWQAWAAANGIHPAIQAFIAFRPNLLFDFNPQLNPREFASPRSWHALSDVLDAAPPESLLDTARGSVGAGPATEFVAFFGKYKKLPNLDVVLANPTVAPVPKEPDVLYAVVCGLNHRVKEQPTKAPALAAYGARLPDEFSMLALRNALSIDSKLMSNPDFQAWLAKARAKGILNAA